jgi:hypothetical protein
MNNLKPPPYAHPDWNPDKPDYTLGSKKPKKNPKTFEHDFSNTEKYKKFPH